MKDVKMDPVEGGFHIFFSGVSLLQFLLFISVTFFLKVTK